MRTMHHDQRETAVGAVSPAERAPEENAKKNRRSPLQPQTNQSAAIRRFGRQELGAGGRAPAGGGSFLARIEPCQTLKPIQLVNRGEITGKTAPAIVANLPRNIAQRELNTVADLLK